MDRLGRPTDGLRRGRARRGRAIRDGSTGSIAGGGGGGAGHGGGGAGRPRPLATRSNDARGRLSAAPATRPRRPPPQRRAPRPGGPLRRQRPPPRCHGQVATLGTRGLGAPPRFTAMEGERRPPGLAVAADSAKQCGKGTDSKRG